MWQRLAVYRRTGGWLARDIVRTLRGRIGLLLILTGAVLASQAAMFGTFILFVQALSSGEPLTVDRIGLSVGAGDTMIWGAALLVAGLAMALLTVGEADYRNRLAARYAQNAVGRVIAILSRSDPDLSLLANRVQTPGQQTRLLTGDFLIMARAALSVMQTMLPLLKLAVAIPLLLYLYPEMAIFLPVLALIYATPYFLLNKRVINASRQREENAGPLRQAAKEVSDEITANQQAPGAAPSHAGDAYPTSKPVRDQLGYYRIFRTTSSALEGLNGMFLTVMIIGIIILFGGQPPEDAIVNMAIFAVVLLHAFSATNGLTSSAAMFNRFLPNIERYTAVLRQGDDTDRQATVRASGGRQRPTFRCAGAEDPLPGSLEKLTPQTGATCVVFGMGPLHPKSADAIIQALGGRRAFRSRRPLAAMASPNLASRPLWDIASAGASDGQRVAEERLRQLLGDAGYETETATLPDGLNTLWSKASGEIGDALALALMISPALESETAAILVPMQVWVVISSDARERIRDALPHVVWGLVSPGHQRDLREAFDYAVFATPQGIIGLGDRAWAMGVVDTRPDLMREPARDRGSSAAADDDEQEDG